ncbi:MAG TPA: CHASE3 domain-containing protein [Bryobacteraceae bacterium]|nr:CHASE3 domain-containing protein [Bryobacteraceae bacterium]
MKIGARILLGYGLALIVAGIVGVVAYRATAELITSAAEVAHTHLVKESLADLLSSFKDAETGQRGLVLTGDESYLDPYTNALPKIDGDVRKVRELTADNPSQQARISALGPPVQGKLQELARTIAIYRQRGQRAAIAEVVSNRGKIFMDDIRRIVADMDAEESRLLDERAARANETAQFSSRAMIWGGVAVLVLVSIVGLLVQRSITGPLAVFMQFAGRVGDGDLTGKSTIQTGDELGELGKSLDQMVGGLKDVATQARFATENLAAASAEILASTQQQAASTGEQAAAVQQTTITMEEVTQSSAQIAERARQVSASAEATAAASHAGLQAMESTSRTMENIRAQAEAVAGNVVSLSEKTQAIGEIIATVNDLAEQSHLLALNAAIEAAAAGEHGRSFSVIAGEVKNLADQSREATVQVRGILGDIQKGINSSVMLTEEAVKRVESGKQQAEVANGAIRALADSIQQSVQAFQQIAAGSNQQQIGFTQVMQAVRDIGQASRQNASGTQQLEKSALNLSALSQQLQKAVERYRV